MKVTKEEIQSALRDWGNGLATIAKTYREKGDYKKVATDFIKRMYNYDHGEVLFKPTLAAQVMFRPTFEGALSYFVGGDKNFAEDNGFAIKDWREVNFDLAGFITAEDCGMVMGNKLLLDGTGNTTVANFTMGFTRNSKGQLVISLHHSSLPFKA
jgi:hypothetical protein